MRGEQRTKEQQIEQGARQQHSDDGDNTSEAFVELGLAFVHLVDQDEALKVIQVKVKITLTGFSGADTKT